ncbi:hypothetical protein Sgleb_36610 [Streptomyces glebosus]|uniref:Uncharacterized protein n=1 Tax=Streptomyces glebosus TaxID=249580 RepID=A0A640SXL1_9ACTN|nr:hypothetical protein Sgleb_36610 [Streptomyces glebosus]GHG51699.1 hypothetical protein GCM10010513_11320 [Streptomyces glebosus]
MAVVRPGAAPRDMAGLSAVVRTGAASWDVAGLSAVVRSRMSGDGCGAWACGGRAASAIRRAYVLKR